MAFLLNLRPGLNGKHGGHRRASSVTSSLPQLSENSSSHDALSIPQHSSYRSSSRLSSGRVPGSPGFEFEDFSPPQFGTFSEAYSSASEKNGERLVMPARGSQNDNKPSTKNGSWLRLALLGVVILLVILGIGLGVGLSVRNRNKSSSTAKNGVAGSASSTSSSSPSSSGPASVEAGPANSPSSAAFPAGSYTFNTYLSTPLTDCTNNPSAWTCYPNTTYAQSASSSGASFDWTISKVPNTPNNYTISSIQNPFALNFTDLPLNLLSAGTADEHYFLQTSMKRTTNPTTQLGSGNAAATCYFDDTTFQAYLYTKKPKTYSKTGDSGSASDGAWPYAVKIEQVSAGGAGTPSCLDPSGKSLGDFSVGDNGQLCDCLYLNTGT